MRIISLSDVKLPITADERQLRAIARKKLGGAEPKYFAIRKKSLDARDKENLRFVYSIEFSKESQKEEKTIFPRLPKEKQPENKGSGKNVSASAVQGENRNAPAKKQPASNINFTNLL